MAELTVPQIDFSTLGNLPAVYKQAQADNLRQQTLASLGQGGTADAQALLRSGDLSLAQLGIGLQNTEYQHGRDSKNDTRQAAQDALTQQHWQASYGLQKRAADRADEGPVEQAGYRATVALKYGIDPNTPEGRAFIVSGKLPETLAGGGEEATAGSRAKIAPQYGIQPGTPEFKTYVLTGKLPDSVGNGGNPEVGLNPAYGVGPDGKPAAIQFSKTGKAVQTQLPDGFSLSKEPLKIDMGTHIQLYDPTTRQPIGSPISKNLAAVEQQKVVGEEAGKGQVALPNVIANSEQILKTLDGIDNHPGKSISLGMGSLAPTIPGTKQADFRANLDQLNGQTFLQAYQTLKGGGAITDIEGAKGSNALARMQTAQSEASFNAALKDFKQVVQSGVERAKAKAAGSSLAPSSPSTSTSPQGNVTSSGVKWSIQ